RHAILFGFATAFTTRLLLKASFAAAAIPLGLSAGAVIVGPLILATASGAITKLILTGHYLPLEERRRWGWQGAALAHGALGGLIGGVLGEATAHLFWWAGSSAYHHTAGALRHYTGLGSKSPPAPPLSIPSPSQPLVPDAHLPP